MHHEQKNRVRAYSTVAYWAVACIAVIMMVWTGRVVSAQVEVVEIAALEASFEQHMKPFLNQNCLVCHNEDVQTAGVRVDHLDSSLDDRQLQLWELLQGRILDESMPPATMPQPSGADRRRAADWIAQALQLARTRPALKNGIVRRLTVPQYRNTLRELLHLEDNLTDILPPDAISRDGFVNNVETLELSPLSMESYFEIAREALDRSIVDPDSKPSIQNFRVDLGASINPNPLTEELILGANNLLLETPDYVVSQVTPSKPFSFDPLPMRTKFRFIEGYQGNATVRGWRDFDSIYHAVFADMRGSRGYPKGMPYSTVPEGLLLRPAIPSDELFGSDGTYGPKANFKISLRELPDHGRFRVTVAAAKYNDGLMLDRDDPAQSSATAGAATIIHDPESPHTIEIEQPGVYQVDIFEAPQSVTQELDASKLGEGLAGSWSFESDTGLSFESDAQLIESPFGQSLSLDGDGDSVLVPYDEGMNVGTGDFTVAAWIYPSQLRGAGIAVGGGFDQKPGWRFGVANGRGALQLATTGPGKKGNGTLASPPGAIRAREWQHVAAVVRRDDSQARLYVNGYPVAVGEMGRADLANPGTPLHIGRVSYGRYFRGQIDEVRVYRRALDPAELRALLQPGPGLPLTPPELPQDVKLTLGDRHFSGSLSQPAFMAVQLDAGRLDVEIEKGGLRELDRIVLTPLASEHDVAQRVRTFEQRVPSLGVYLGLRRDCGSTLVPVGDPQRVPGTDLTRFVFEGAISDFPSPDVEDGNVNYLAGFREIGVRSEYTDGRDMPRLLIRSVEFEGPLLETWPPPSHAGIFSDFERKSDTSAYARKILGDFATRAYRRPANADEVASLMSVFDRSLSEGLSFQESVKEALHVVLVSPQFLFLVESSATPEAEPVDDFELASKLSYFLWNGPPDEATLSLATDGLLRRRLDDEVTRMIESPRFAEFADQFVSQWLSLDKFDVLEPDQVRFPKLTRATRSQLRREPVEFLRYLVDKNLPLSNLLDSDVVVANEVVASYYGLDAKSDSGLEFVPIVHSRPELGGVLTQAALMAGLSDGRESNPVKRGAWLARKIIAEPPADPPPNVPDLEADTKGLSLRQRLEQHRTMPGCVQCHTLIDPWGVALEELDAGGRLKQEPADAQSELPDGTEVTGVNELKRYLSQDRIDQVAFSVLKHLAAYANGRSLTYNELNSLKQDGLSLRDGDYRLQDMIRFTINSEMFLEK